MMFNEVQKLQNICAELVEVIPTTRDETPKRRSAAGNLTLRARAVVVFSFLIQFIQNSNIKKVTEERAQRKGF